MHPKCDKKKELTVIFVHIIEEVPYQNIQNNQRWALGKTGCDYLLGFYTNFLDALLVSAYLENASHHLPGGKIEVIIYSMSTNEVEENLYHDNLENRSIWKELKVNYFYPEGLLNGEYPDLPAIPVNEIGDFLSIDQNPDNPINEEENFLIDRVIPHSAVPDPIFV